MRKRILTILIGIILGFSGTGNALLINRGAGMIYDSDLNITWLADANYALTSGYDSDGRMNWFAAKTWADNLVYGGFDDWRLPYEGGMNCSTRNNPDPNAARCASSEMGHLFYSELGGIYGSSVTTSGDPDLALFSNIQSTNYWAYGGGSYEPGCRACAFYYNLGYGYQGSASANYGSGFAWAVRSGDVPTSVPEPSTLLLVGSGLAAMTLYGKRRSRLIV
jgi:hypothetical protein